jgi:hypothetical protein
MPLTLFDPQEAHERAKERECLLRAAPNPEQESMSVQSVSAAPAPAAAAPPVAPRPARASDGDYKKASFQTSQAKDSDGDYKSLANAAAAQSSAGVQASLTSLKAGG